MSVTYSQMPSELLTDPDMTLSAVRVWHVIFTETLGRPGWDLSYQQIGDHIGSDRRTAMRAVELLVEKGWIIRQKQQGKGSGDAPNLFVICREPFTPWNQQHSLTPGGDTADTGGSVTADTHQKNHLPEEEKHGAAAPSVDDPRITQFALISPPALAVVKDEPKSEPKSGTNTVLGAYLQWRTDQGLAPMPPTIRGRLGKAIKEALDSGISEHVVKTALMRWHKDGQTPASLPSFIDSVARNGGKAREPKQSGRAVPQYITDPKTGLLVRNKEWKRA